MRRAALVCAAALTLAACSGGTDEPSAADELSVAEVSAADCAADLATVQAALTEFLTAEGTPAPDEAALVSAGYLDTESDAVDVAGGQVVAQVPECASAVPDAPVPTAPSGSAPLTAPATDVGEIVTGTEPVQMTTEAVLATMTELDIEAYGGRECATEIAAISVAAQRFIEREGRDPDDLAELADDLDREIALWDFDAENLVLVPADGSPCVDAFAAAATDPVDSCEAERADMQAAIDAFTAVNGAPPSDENQLVGAGLLPAPSESFDVVDGSAVAVPDSPCG